MIGQIYQEYLFCAESVPVLVKQDYAITFLYFEKSLKGSPLEKQVIITSTLMVTL